MSGLLLPVPFAIYSLARETAGNINRYRFVAFILHSGTRTLHNDTLRRYNDITRDPLYRSLFPPLIRGSSMLLVAPFHSLWHREAFISLLRQR